jgi:hypothetical protein
MQERTRVRGARARAHTHTHTHTHAHTHTHTIDVHHASPNTWTCLPCERTEGYEAYCRAAQSPVADPATSPWHKRLSSITRRISTLISPRPPHKRRTPALLQLQRAGRLHEPVARWFFQQLILGVDHCHARGVANRDLKLENTLLQVGGWRGGCFGRLHAISGQGMRRSAVTRAQARATLGRSRVDYEMRSGTPAYASV